MINSENLCDDLKTRMLGSAPDVWGNVRNAAARVIAEQLVNELNGVPSRCGKLVNEQVNEMPVKGRVA